MSEGKRRLHVTAVFFPDPILLANGWALLELEENGPKQKTGVLPACASLLAAAALELALETSLWAAESNVRAGIHPYGDLDLGQLSQAHDLSMGAKVLRVPELVSGGVVSVTEASGVPIRTLHELVRLRNELVHPMGSVIDEPTDLVVTEEEALDGSWVDAVRKARSERPRKEPRVTVSIEDGTMTVQINSAFERFGWLEVRAEQAKRYLDAVEHYNADCLHRLFVGSP